MNGKIEVLDDDDCIDEKPDETRECTLRPCEGVDWITSSWGGVRILFCCCCYTKIRPFANTTPFIFSAKPVALRKKHVQLTVLRNQVPFTTKHFVQIEKSLNSHVNAKHRLVTINGSNLSGANARPNAVMECKLEELCVVNSTEIPYKRAMTKVNAPMKSQLPKRNVR